MPMTEILGPAMRMAREGVPAHEISSRQVRKHGRTDMRLNV